MSKQITSDKIAEAIDTLKQAGFSVFEPGFVPHVLIEINDSEVVSVQSNTHIRCVTKDNWTDGMDACDIVGLIDDGKELSGGYFIYTPQSVTTIEGMIYDAFAPSDTIGGLEPDRPALYEYFKSINF